MKICIALIKSLEKSFLGIRAVDINMNNFVNFLLLKGRMSCKIMRKKMIKGFLYFLGDEFEFFM